MAKQYTTVEAVENYLLIDIDEAFESQVESWIEAISIYMDKKANRILMADAADVVYKYDGNGGTELFVSDVQAITSLVVDGTTIASDDYYLYPSNGTPKNRIILDGYYFSRDRQNVVVTGKFGLFADGELPEDLKLAATILVAGVINRSNSKGRRVQSETIGKYSVTYKNDEGWADYKAAMDIINQYRKVTF